MRSGSLRIVNLAYLLLGGMTDNGRVYLGVSAINCFLNRPVMFFSRSSNTEVEVNQVFEKLTQTCWQLRHCDDADSLLRVSVEQVQHLYNGDRSLICRALPEHDGTVVAEVVSEDWLPLLGRDVYVPPVAPQSIKGLPTPAFTAIDQVENSSLDAAEIASLQRCQVKAYLASAIWINAPPTNVTSSMPQLWGWLVIHYCQSGYPWKTIHGQVLQHIAGAIGTALEQLQLREHLEAVKNQAAAMVQQTESKYQQATRACSIGVWDWDLQTNEIYLDPLLKEMLGYQDEEIRNHIDDWVQYVYPEDMPEVMAAATEHLEGRSPEYRVEHRMVHRDGHLVWVLAQGTALRLADGTPYRMVGTDIDITDRKMAELELQTSEAFRRRVMELVPIPLFIYNIELGQLTYCNPAYEDSLGYTLAEIQAMGRNYLSFLYHPDYREQMEAHDQKIWADRAGRVYELEYHCRRKDGSTVIAYSREVVLSRQANGRPKEILGFGIDLTERKAMEAALRESNALYQSLTEAMPQCLYRKDRNQRYIYANPALLSWLQITEPALIGKSSCEVFPSDLATRYDDEDRQVLSTGEIFDIVDWHQMPGQSQRTYVHVVKSPVRDSEGNIVGTQGIFWDVTERQHLKQELQESRDQLAMILNSLHASVNKFRLIDGSLDVVYEYFSPGTEIVFGYSIKALMENSRLWQSRIEPEDWENRVKPGIQDLIMGQPYKTIEYRFRHPDNSIHWIQETASAYRDDTHRCWILTTVATDISSRKQAEFDLEQTRNVLQQVLDNLPVGVLAKTADTLQFTVWNPACTQLMGYTRDEVLGRTDYDLFPPAQAERCTADDRETIASRHLWERPEECIVNKTGESRIIHNRKVAVCDVTGQAQLVVGIVEDITARVAAETALRQREEEFRTLVENSPDGIFRVNAELRIQYVNPTVARRLARPQAELLGQHLADLDLPSALRVQWQTALTKVLNSGQPLQLETQEPLPAGTYAFQARLVPEPNAHGHIASVLVVSRDITSLKQAQLALQRWVNQEHSLRMITQHMRESLDLDAILATAVTEVQKALRADRTLIFQLTSDHSGVVIQECSRPEYPTTLAMRFEDEHFPPDCYEFYCQGRGRIVVNINEDDWAACLAEFMQRVGVQSKMVAPITQNRPDGTVRVWGLLIVHACAIQRRWEPDELELLQQVASQLAIALQQSELHQQLLTANQELEYLSTTDSLTQIANRRQFDDTLTAEWQRAHRDQREFTLILCDIDYFKQYNDTYGHPTGDDCLMAVAKALQSCVNRVTDCIARYGGEEFAIILPYTNLEGAILVVENMQAAIAVLNIDHITHPTSPQVTLSFGITVALPPTLPEAADLVRRADLALYQAKQAGRNRYAVVLGRGEASGKKLT
jgi:diguanylate cyclase (GGDEF)-like protein/PAS domain S-box-containing protein